MRRVGQPFERLGDSYGVCATTSAGKRTLVHIDFTELGLVHMVRV